MKQFLKNIAIIIGSLVLLFLLTLLLEIPFIQALVIRQILVYLVMVLIAFLCYRLITLINRIN